MTTTVLVSSEGDLRVPREALDALGIDGDTEFLLDIDEAEGTLTLRPGAGSEDEYDDEWLYTPESVASYRRALDDIAHGRVRLMSEEELLKLAPADDE